MLRAMHIENIAVIKRLDLDFDCGLTAMTGETGAGKSIIIDSINFLLCSSSAGGKTGRELIRAGESKAVVSALFDGICGAVADELAAVGVEAEDGEICLERSLTADGKTSCRISGRSVTQALLRRVGGALVSIHGQNENQRLTDKNNQLSMLDIMAHDDELLARYRSLYGDLTNVRNEIRELDRGEKDKNQLRDMLEYQIKDISSQKLKPGEEERLTDEKKKLSSLERIKKQSDIALRAIYANEKGLTASYLVSRAADALLKLSDVYPEYRDFSERLSSCRFEIDDIAAEVAQRLSGASGDDPTARIDAIESRLESISKLKRKYGSTVDEILEFYEKAKRRYDDIELGDERLSELKGKEKSLLLQISEAGDALSELRSATAADIEVKVADSLVFLDMPKVRFKISVTPVGEPTPYGTDEVEFLISTNPGEPLRPLSQIASGGELSRIMLSLKSVMTGIFGVPTIIYDEVDTGISGKTSRKVGIKLKESSKDAQVICVTHSAQIASLADRHMLILKREIDGRSESTVSLLDYEGRIEETARILGGINVTELQRLAAKELMSDAVY